MLASVRLAAASAVAASLFATALPARSADLYGPRYGSAYDNQEGYGDRYGDRRPYVEERYGEAEEEFAPPHRDRHAYKDDDFDAYGRYDFPRYANRVDGCVPRRVAHRRIRADGWRDFGNFESRGTLVYMQARGPSGRRFDLTVDTCSGDILEAKPLSTGRSYAGTPRRYWQRY
jgi:hypothetical protein